MMMLLVATTTTRFVMDVEDSDTIDMVKTKIQWEYDIPIKQQSLIFAGKRMVSGTLSDYNICEFDTIVCVTPVVVGARRVGRVY